MPRAIDAGPDCGESSVVQLPFQAFRAIVPLVVGSLLLALASVVFVGRDMAFARNEAETEIVAFAETSALAVQLVPAAELDAYLTDLLKHPAIATATVYLANGERTTRRRPITSDSSVLMSVVPSFGEAVVGCRAVGDRTVCVEGDRGYFRARLAALVVPHILVLAAAALLFLVALRLRAGSSRQQIRELTRIVRGATDENNYSLRAAEEKGDMGELSAAVNGLLEQMQQRDLILRRRTTELESVNKELEAFSYSVSHDLRSPIASIDGFSQALHDMYGDTLDESGREYLGWIREGVDQMKNLVAGLLQMSRITRSELNRESVNLSETAQSIAHGLMQRNPTRSVDFQIQPQVIADADARLLHAVLENLMSNAFKFTGKTENATITVGVTNDRGKRTYFVRDNGAGFDSAQAAKMFTPFQRLHSSTEFEGTGIGLATVKRIIERHGGAIWADGRVGQGATFSFTLGENVASATRGTAQLTQV
jgi:signal transduction histidine kinase